MSREVDLFRQVEIKAGVFCAPYEDPKLLELLGLVGDFTGARYLLVGLDALLGENAGYVYVGNGRESNSALVQFHRPPVEGIQTKYDIFVFGGNPPVFVNHYTNHLKDGESVFGGKLRICPREKYLGGRLVCPLLSVLSTALCPEVIPDAGRN